MRTKLEILYQAWSEELLKMRPNYTIENFQQEIEADPQLKRIVDVTLKAMEMYRTEAMPNFENDYTVDDSTN